MADLGDIDVAGAHGGDLSRAAGELIGLYRQAHFLKVTLVDRRKQGGGGAQVGHVGHADRGGLIGGSLRGLGLRGLRARGLGLSRIRRGSSIGGVIAAGGQSEDHAACQQQREKFLLHLDFLLIF